MSPPVHVRWICNPAILTTPIAMTADEAAEIADCETLIALCEKRGFPVFRDYGRRIREIKRGAALRAHPDCFSPSVNAADAAEASMPSIVWVGGSQDAMMTSETKIPPEINEKLGQFLELFRELYVRWNEKGDASLFAVYGISRFKRHALLAQWSDPPDLTIKMSPRRRGRQWWLRVRLWLKALQRRRARSEPSLSTVA